MYSVETKVELSVATTIPTENNDPSFTQGDEIKVTGGRLGMITTTEQLYMHRC